MSFSWDSVLVDSYATHVPAGMIPVDPTCRLRVADNENEKVKGTPGSERRAKGSRWHEYKNCAASLDGRMVHIEDVSEVGARVKGGATLAKDAVVLLDLPWGKVVRADVIDSGNGVTRLKFHFPIEQPY